MKKKLMKFCALFLSGTCLITLNSCLNENNKSKKYTRLNGKYGLEGYYLTDTPFEGLYVIKADNKLKIIDKERNFITSDGKQQKNEEVIVHELYSFLNKDLLNITELTKEDYIELEQYINGNTNVTFIDNQKKKYNDLLTDENKYYYQDRDIYYFDADSDRIEILFLDDKANRIVRRLEYGASEPYTGKTEDMISGNIINPKNHESSYVSFDKDMIKQHGNSKYEYIPLSNYFNNELKEKFTGEEIKDLYFSIRGKTKEEVEQILSNLNFNNIDKPKTLVRKY